MNDEEKNYIVGGQSERYYTTVIVHQHRKKIKQTRKSVEVKIKDLISTITANVTSKLSQRKW